MLNIVRTGVCDGQNNYSASSSKDNAEKPHETVLYGWSDGGQLARGYLEIGAVAGVAIGARLALATGAEELSVRR